MPGLAGGPPGMKLAAGGGGPPGMHLSSAAGGRRDQSPAPPAPTQNGNNNNNKSNGNANGEMMGAAIMKGASISVAATITRKNPHVDGLVWQSNDENQEEAQAARWLSQRESNPKKRRRAY